MAERKKDEEAEAAETPAVEQGGELEGGELEAPTSGGQTSSDEPAGEGVTEGPEPTGADAAIASESAGEDGTPADQPESAGDDATPSDEPAVDDAPTAAEPSEGEPTAAEPSEGEPMAAEPSEGEPMAAEPSEGEPAAAESEEAVSEAEDEERPEERPAHDREPAPALVELAADARYSATGKRKSAIARVILRPGNGAFELNGHPLDRYFPRRTLQEVVRQPLKVSGYLDRIDVRARIHGGGVSSQADAVRHGIAKALTEADPNLRTELKRRQFLTRDPRVKERRKAGLKKARKRPQFSKR